jgi:hypothetical protein
MESESVQTRFESMQFGRFRDHNVRPSPKAFVVSVSNGRQRQRIRSSKWRLVTRLLGLPLLGSITPTTHGTDNTRHMDHAP